MQFVVGSSMHQYPHKYLMALYVCSKSHHQPFVVGLLVLAQGLQSIQLHQRRFQYQHNLLLALVYRCRVLLQVLAHRCARVK